MIHLYVKTHNITGLKYFGKTTSKDPHKYKGSGVRWVNHIEYHGYDVTTEIIGSFCDIDECLEFAVKFSIENNIVESADWANLKLETLDGGFDHINSLPIEIRRDRVIKWWNALSDERKSEINKLKAHPKEKNFWWCKDRSGENNPMFGVNHSDETKVKISEANKNKIVVKDLQSGKVIGLVDKEHEKIKSGEWGSVNIGKTHSSEYKQRKSDQYKTLGIRPPSPKGKLWWNNGLVNERSVDCPGEDFIRGRLKFSKTVYNNFNR